MSSSSMKTLPSQEADDQTNQELYQHFTNLLSSLPSCPGLSMYPLHRDKNGYYSDLPALVSTMVSNERFDARPSDIIIATSPKSGTTWIKAILFATVHRREHPADRSDQHPFNYLSPHECIKFLEYQLYVCGKIPNLEKLLDPRIFATHVPFVCLPQSVPTSGCKVIYVCRDPKDVVISLWVFMNKLIASQEGKEPFSVETAAELFCDGKSTFGPYWEHVLSYWRAHLAHPEQVLFFRYEEMTRDPTAHVRRLAKFIGVPFSVEEEESGTVDDIVRLCSFEHMSNLEATKCGKTETAVGAVANNMFYRHGKVGDWVNHLSPEMAQRIDAITQEKFRGYCLNI